MTILHTTQLDGFTPSRLVVADSGGGLQASTVARTHGRKALVAGDSAGTHDAPQVAELRLNGLTASNSDGGTLLWDIHASGSAVVFALHNGSTLVASGASGSLPEFPLRLNLVSQSGSGITGTVVLESGQVTGSSSGQRVHLPLPRPAAGPYIHGDEDGPGGSPQIRLLQLEGLDSGNSDDGKVIWKLQKSTDELPIVRFSLYKDSSTRVAMGEIPEGPELPLEIALRPDADSGLSGHVVLNSANTAGNGSDQWAEVLSPAARAWITGDEDLGNLGEVRLSRVHGGTSDEGILSWTYGYVADELWFTVHAANGPVARGNAGASPAFPLTLMLSALNKSEVSGSVVLLDDEALDSDAVEQVGSLIVRAPVGVALAEDLTIARNHEVRGNAAVAGGASFEDLTVGSLRVKDAAAETARILAADASGKLTTMRPMAAPIYTQYSSPMIEASYGYGTPMSLFPESEHFDAGSRDIPSTWWSSGKRLTVKQGLAWSGSEFSGATLRVTLEGLSNTVVLLDTALPDPADVGGPAILKIELIAVKASGSPDTLELRGHCLLNGELHPVLLTGLPLIDYTYDVTVELGDLDEYSYILPYSATLIAWEEPRAQGLNTLA